MGYSIEPVQIWTNGEAKEGNNIEALICDDNLSNYAQLKWVINNVINDQDGIQIQILTQGYVEITGQDYVTWGESQDVNLAAYQYICTQLNLTLIP